MWYRQNRIRTLHAWVLSWLKSNRHPKLLCLQHYFAWSAVFVDPTHATGIPFVSFEDPDIDERILIDYALANTLSFKFRQLFAIEGLRRRFWRNSFFSFNRSLLRIPGVYLDYFYWVSFICCQFVPSICYRGFLPRETVKISVQIGVSYWQLISDARGSKAIGFSVTSWYYYVIIIVIMTTSMLLYKH